MQVECQFCQALSTPVEHRPMFNKPLTVTAHAEVIPSLGSLVPGWLLVVPKAHYLAAAETPPGSDIAHLLMQTESLVEQRYGRVVSFEHGAVASGTAVGCTVDHAHVHVLPLEVSLRALLRDVGYAPPWAEISSLHEARTAVGGGHYLMVHEDGETFAAPHPPDVGQLARRAIASHLGIADAYDWRTHPRLETVAETLASLALQPT